jgi:predicted dehydrogenase
MISRIPPRNSRALRVAIIGAGMMGHWHGRAAGRLGAKLVAIVDPDRGRANALARRLRVGMTADDMSALLREGCVDAVHICSPPSTHAALARGAIESGVHAFVEKPLVRCAEGTRRLVDIARRHGVVLCPVHQIAFQDGIEHAAQALAELGEPCMIDIRICSAGGIGRTEGELDEILGDILPHPLSILRRFWPHAGLEPQHWFVSRPRAGELSASGMHAGAHLSMLISMHARPTRFEMMVCGQRGAVQLDFFHGFAVRHDGRVSRWRKAAQPFGAALKVFGAASVNLAFRGLHGEVAYPGLRRLMQAFYAATRGEAPPPIAPFPISDGSHLLAKHNNAFHGGQRQPIQTIRKSTVPDQRNDDNGERGTSRHAGNT